MIATVLPPGLWNPGITALMDGLAGSGTVLGSPGSNGLPRVDFHAVAGTGFRLSSGARYGTGVMRVLGRLRPALVEVHGQPELASRVARRFPRVVLFERGAGSKPVAGVARVVTLPYFMDVPSVMRRVRQKIIVFAGRFTAEDGADAFIDACVIALPRLHGWRAEMICTDPVPAGLRAGGFLDTLHRRAAQSGVVWRGHMPQAGILDRLGRASIAVAPSRSEAASGVFALQAMAHGAALVCSRRGGLAEMAGETARYAEPDAAGAFAKAILALAADTGGRLAMANNAHRRALAFDTAEIVRTVQQLRSDILGERDAA